MEETQTHTSLDQLIWLEDEIELAENQGAVRGIPADKRHFELAMKRDDFAPVLRDRLFRLGYLSSEGVDEANPMKLRAAVRKLQKEAGLAIDGWVGEKSWSALQALFTFENPSNLRHWNTPQSTPFFQRATELRMRTLGILPAREQVSGTDISSGWETWGRLVVALNLAAPGIDEPGLASLLFDIDRLTEQVAKRRQSLSRLCAKEDALSKHLIRFVSCLLKVELWLHGYSDIKPDGRPLSLHRKRRQTRAPSYKYSPDYRLLRQFWKDTGLTRTHGEDYRMLLRCFPELTDSTPGSVDNEKLERLLADNQQLADKEWNEQGWGAWIWDGVKRIFKAIRNWFRTVKDKLKQTLRLAVRYAKQLVSESVGYVRNTFSAIEQGMSLLLRSEVKGSNDKVAMGHDRDFDFKVFVSERATDSEVSSFVISLSGQVEGLKVATRLCRLIIKLIKGGMLLAAGPWSWWRLIKLLLQIHPVLLSDASYAD